MKYGEKRMKMKDIEPKLEEWVKIDNELNEKLKDLEALELQKNEILARAEKMGELTDEIKEEMETSIKLYSHLAKQVQALKARAEEIKKN